jgi:hypothetical protein
MRLVALRSMDAHHTPGYREPPEDIIGRCHQALWIMPPSFTMETALGIELLTDLLGCRKVVFGAIEGNCRHSVPDIGGVTRIEAVRQLDSPRQHVPEEGPGDLPASLGECTAVNLLGIGPQSAPPGRSAEIPGLDVHPLALPARHERKDKGDELGKGEFPLSGKIPGRLSGIRVNLFGDEIKKSCKDSGELA